MKLVSLLSLDTCATTYIHKSNYIYVYTSQIQILHRDYRDDRPAFQYLFSFNLFHTKTF